MKDNFLFNFIIFSIFILNIPTAFSQNIEKNFVFNFLVAMIQTDYFSLQGGNMKLQDR